MQKAFKNPEYFKSKQIFGLCYINNAYIYIEKKEESSLYKEFPSVSGKCSLALCKLVSQK